MFNIEKYLNPFRIFQVSLELSRVKHSAVYMSMGRLSDWLLKIRHQGQTH